MKILKTICLLAAISLAVSDSVPGGNVGKIAGTVCDEKGNGIPGVSVRIESTYMGAAAAFDGTYVILNVPEGEYTLVAQSIGYNKMTVENVKVVADSTTIVDFQLASEAIQSQDIVVTAERVEIDKYIASNQCRMSSEELATKPVTTIGDVLRQSTGFVQQNGVFHARGGRGNEVAYMVDGAEVRDCLGGYTGNQFFIHYPPYPIRHNTEAYDNIVENEFRDALAYPLSTFSIDVDKASYSNTRRFLNSGSLPPPDAVRIEEFINYFNYDYPQPEKGVPFSVTTEISECPWQEGLRLLHIGLQGKKIPMDHIPPGNLVFLIDVSGSMNHPDKLPLLKSAFKLLVGQLRKNDRVAIVVYASASGMVLDSTPGNDKEKILAAIESLYPGGSTAGSAGIKLAYEIAKKNYIEKGNNRVILATDGDFNVGVSSDGELVKIIEKKREEGVFLTVLGFGTGNYKDSKMEKLADKGNGNYAYIDNIMEARKVLVNELGGTLFTIAKDVKIQIEFNPARILAYRLIGYENRILAKEDFNDDKKDAGEIGAGHTVTALYEIIPAGTEVNIGDIDNLKYQRNSIRESAFESAELLTLKLRYKDPDKDKSKLISSVVIDQRTEMSGTSDNFRFSAAVAEFGMLLRDSKFKGNSSYDKVVKLAEKSAVDDSEGYKAEFIRLVKLAGDLSKAVAEK